MSSKKTELPGRSDAASDTEARPEWADGLKQLYDSVVEEPLPDTFKDLLARFDEEGPDAATHEDGGTA